VTWTAS